MRTKVGLWIDHRKAIVIGVTNTGEVIADGEHLRDISTSTSMRSSRAFVMRNSS